MDFGTRRSESADVTPASSGAAPSLEGKLSAFDALAAPTHDERSRQQFVSALRKHIIVDMAAEMRREYSERVLPGFEATHRRAPRDGFEVRKAMLPNPYFRAWSALRYTAQEMTWASVRPMIERGLPSMIAAAKVTATATQTAGSLRLDPDLKIPRDMQQLDIHLMPGGFHTELAPDDVAAGALYTHGTAVFFGGFTLRARGGGVAKSIAKYLEAAFPEFRPRKILDLGCTTGGNLLPYLEVFPEAEGYGVDVGAPLLRYAHARAESLNMRVHYSQQDAQQLDFPDGAFDIVCSSFFLHEHSAQVTRRVFREAFRVLKPGGVMVHMELPPAALTDPYYSFYLDWDAYYNNEPHYAAFRALDLSAEVARAGFAKKRFFQLRIPNFGTVPDDKFVAVARGKEPPPPHGNGASWFIFGAWKPPAAGADSRA
jgi:SAM-dependent methyltransferase